MNEVGRKGMDSAVSRAVMQIPRFARDGNREAGCGFSVTLWRGGEK